MKNKIDREEVLEKLRQELPVLGSNFGVERIAIFGSFASNTPTAESDIDIIVQLSHPLGLAFFGLAAYLEQILGRKVDLITMESLRRGFTNPRRAKIAHSIEGSLIYA